MRKDQSTATAERKGNVRPRGEVSDGAKDTAVTPAPTDDGRETKQDAPLCAEEGCNAVMRKKRDGSGYFEKCYFHAHQANGATSGDWDQCRVEGCTKQRYVNPENGRRSPCCSLECLNKWRASSGMVRAQVCYFCQGRHGVLACPGVNEERRKLMEQHLGYRHELSWWKVKENRDKAKAFRLSKYRANP